MEKIYIAGKVTGDKGYKGKFARTADTMAYHMEMCGPKHCQFCPFHSRDYIYGCIIRGHKDIEIVNPATFPLEGRSWLRCMLYCLRKMARCKYVYMLQDWEDSKGARWEHRVATWFNKTIIYQ